MDVRWVPNQSENDKFNMISVCFNKISHTHDNAARNDAFPSAKLVWK